MRVAVAGCRFSPSSPPNELYPDPDAAVLVPALSAAGASDVAVVSWDDPAVDWSSFDVVFVSGTWDSVDRPDEYVAWTASVSGSSSAMLLNPHEVVVWNLDKRYLRDLESAGLPVVPTTWIGPADAVSQSTLPAGDVVVKPVVSAGGRSTAWYGAASHDAALAHVASLQALGASVMVQEHVAGVASVGEVKSVYVDGGWSHAVRVGGLLERDAGIMESPWEKVVPVSAVVPSPVERGVGDAVVEELARRFADGPPVYARVDLVLDAVGGPRILEVELIDPLLSLSLAPASAGATERLAVAIVSRGAAAAQRH